MAANTMAVLPSLLVGAMAVFIRDELVFSEFQLGVAAATLPASTALASVTGGRLSERLGPERAMAVAAGGSALCLISIAAFARSWLLLVALLFAAGIANALAAPATNLALARMIPARRLGLAFGIKQAAIPAAILLGGLAVPAIALTVGWRWAFAAGALAAVLVWLAVPGLGDQPIQRVRADRTGDTATGPLVLLAVAAGTGAAAANAVGAFYVESAVAGGLAEFNAGLWLAVGGAVGIVARIGWGWMGDRRGGDYLSGVAGLMAAGAVGLGLLPLVPQTAALVVGTILAFAAAWGWPGLFNYAVVRDNPHAPGAATGVTQAGVAFGAFVGPPIFGALVELFGYGVAWRCAAALLLVAAVLVRVGRNVVRRDVAERSAG